MSQVLTVPTHFNDIGELSEGFLDRVERDTLILYGPVAYEDGSEIEFVVLLADGSPALEGTGRVRAAVDGGADRVPETRYDVVVEGLELDGRYEVVFERLVLARQAVSEPPPADEDEPPTHEMDAVQASDESNGGENAAYIDDIELTAEEVFSLPPDEVSSVAPEEIDAVSISPEELEVETVPPEASAVDTVPPEAFDDDEEEPATVIAAVDAEALMAEAEAEPELEPEPEPEPELEPELEPVSMAEAETVSGSLPAPEWNSEVEDDAGPENEPHLDSEYAFAHGIAAEPRVGMPVPIPSMAAPPETPPAPPTLRLAEPPEGLTRPSLAQVEGALFSTDGEVSDVHTTGLFAYEDGLPIPSRPPLPDLNRPQAAANIEVQSPCDVEDSEPPEASDDEYEEIRLSDFAEAAEEG